MALPGSMLSKQPRSRKGHFPTGLCGCTKGTGVGGGRSGRCSILDHFKIFQVSNHELYEGSSGLTNKHPISIGWLSLLELKLPVPWCSHLLAWVPNIQQLEDHPTYIVAIQ
jgi:hypothetical protein